MEVKLIRDTGANDPAIGYNRSPRHRPVQQPRMTSFAGVQRREGTYCTEPTPDPTLTGRFGCTRLRAAAATRTVFMRPRPSRTGASGRSSS
jgi:hypothetical protein